MPTGHLLLLENVTGTMLYTMRYREQTLHITRVITQLDLVCQASALLDRLYL